MTDSPLTPALALAYLRELSLDVRAAVVVGEDGQILAGDAELADRARSAGGGVPGVRTERSGNEALVLAHTASGLKMAVIAGDFAILPLLAHDVETVLSDLDGPG